MCFSLVSAVRHRSSDLFHLPLLLLRLPRRLFSLPAPERTSSQRTRPRHLPNRSTDSPPTASDPSHACRQRSQLCAVRLPPAAVLRRHAAAVPRFCHAVRRPRPSALRRRCRRDSPSLVRQPLRHHSERGEARRRRRRGRTVRASAWTASAGAEPVRRPGRACAARQEGWRERRVVRAEAARVRPADEGGRVDRDRHPRAEAVVRLGASSVDLVGGSLRLFLLAVPVSFFRAVLFPLS